LIIFKKTQSHVNKYRKKTHTNTLGSIKRLIKTKNIYKESLADTPFFTNVKFDEDGEPIVGDGSDNPLVIYYSTEPIPFEILSKVKTKRGRKSVRLVNRVIWQSLG